MTSWSDERHLMLLDDRKFSVAGSDVAKFESFHNCGRGGFFTRSGEKNLNFKIYDKIIGNHLMALSSMI